MDIDIKNEIDAICRRSRISLDDIRADLDVRDSYPGEFYCMSLMHISTGNLRAYLEASR